MQLIKDPQEWKKQCKSLDGTIGFIPTMGALHEGHLSLIKRAKKECDHVVVSIFVNPLQFNNPKDLESYPRDFVKDQKLLESIGVTGIFLPNEETLYPDHAEVRVMEQKLSKELEGTYRPGHFEGVLTVVLKLLLLASADRAYFGEKDYQQLLLIKKLAKAFFLDTEIISCETLREKSGLAMSSRNLLLSPSEKEKASKIHQIISSNDALEEMKVELEHLGFKIDYLEEKYGRRLIACYLGNVRLIDNVPI